MTSICNRVLMSKPLVLADIIRFSISFSWGRLMCFCMRSVLLRPERSLSRFKLDPSVLHCITFFRMVILVGKTLSRKRVQGVLFFKSSSPVIASVHKNSLFYCRLHFREYWKMNELTSSDRYLYPFMPDWTCESHYLKCYSYGEVM